MKLTSPMVVMLFNMQNMNMLRRLVSYLA